MIFMMNWKDIWMTLFGTVDLLGLNEGFWVSMAVVALIVVVMFDVPQILSNGQGSPNKSTTTIIMYLNQHLFSKNYGTAGALSVLLFLVCGVLCVMIYKLQSKED